ncbi:MAG: abortive infection system antitoxin AbiGi family protein [Bacteroidaceae bacterium]
MKKILQSGYFLPCYSVQYGWGGLDYAIPETCFCDIPKSQIRNHVKYYGSYGIGMSKTWAKRNKISPVFYMDTASKTHNTIANRIKKVKNGEPIEELVYRFLFYAKKVCGMDISFRESNTDPILDSKRKFYDEREWRYVPDIIYKDYIQFGEYRTNKPSFDNSRMHQYGAKFDTNDIEYIIIKSESERKRIVDFLNKSGIGKKDVLISKIESCEHIQNNS